MNAPQQLDQASSFLTREPAKRLSADLVREIQDSSENRARLVGQDEPPGAAIARLGTPLDPSVLFHSVDLPDQGHRLYLEEIGKAGLVDPLVAGKIAEHLALGSGKAEEQKRALVKASSEEACDIVHEKSEAAIEIHGTVRG